MENISKTYRIRTKVGEDAPAVIHVPLNQTYDMFEILSLKLNQKNAYKTYESDYGVLVGRVQANGGVGVQNAKISVFIPVSDDDSEKDKLLYNFASVNGTDNDGIRYNTLPDYVNDACHQNVGTFPNKLLVLDNNSVIEMFDKYWKYTTTTNPSGDYMIFGLPTGSNTVHVDLDLSDCGILSQRPHDMIGKGYNINMFESPNKFKSSTNLNSLAQIYTQDKGVYVYPYWGDTSDGDDKFAITRCDISIEYKFEPTCVFMGSIITDKGSNAIGKNCTATEQNGKMSDLIAGAGKIEMIRKTFDGRIEEYPIMGNRLIDGDGVWCYQIPMNLDYVTTDEFGNLVPTDNPEKGIATRTRVRFRISLDEDPNDGTARKRCRYLVPNNPKLTDPEYADDPKHEPDYEFGSATREESFVDLFWNNVYTVKNYIPKLQKKKKETNRKHTGIKLVNHYGDNNPMPYNALTIKLTFTYRLICAITKAFVNLISVINTILSLIALPFCKIASIKIWKWRPFKFLLKMLANCIKISSEFCDDGINPNVYYPGCYDCLWEKKVYPNCSKEQSKLPKDEMKICTKEKAELMTCIENELAQSNEATSFNFYNDWINGVLYAPLWYRKIRKKKKFFFGLFTRKAKDEWCSADRNFDELNLIQQCVLRRQNGSKKYDNNDGIQVTPRVINNDGGDCAKKSTCHKSYALLSGLKGIIRTKETMLGQTVYYYKPCEFNSKLPSNTYVNQVRKSKNKQEITGENKTLFATDIVLLGSLNACDLYGTPQFFKTLESTTYNMPTDILFTDFEIQPVFGANGKVIEQKVTSRSEMAGADWGNKNEYGKDDGGLFYSIGCSDIHLAPKSCINLSRMCEYGVSLDETKTVADLNKMKSEGNDDDDAFEYLVTDGFVSFDEIYEFDGRSMFATMNGNHLKTTLNKKNGLMEYDFRYLYPQGFDGSMKTIMYNKTKSYSQDVSYKQNYILETFNVDYYKFRMGNEPYFYDSYASFPRYDNSFYFYFGLKAGKTAIEKFNAEYFAECTNSNDSAYKIGVRTEENSWCAKLDNKYDGYILFDFSNLTVPYDLYAESTTNRQFTDEETRTQIDKKNVYDEKIAIYEGDDEDLKEKIEELGYTILEGVKMVENGSYRGSAVDSDGNIVDFVFSLKDEYLTFKSEGKNFRIPNNILGDDYLNIAKNKEGLAQEEEGDFSSYNRAYGGVIILYDFSYNNGDLKYYSIEVRAKDTVGEYGGFAYNSWDTNRPNEILLKKDDNYVIGLPKGDVTYVVTVTQFCDENSLSGTNNVVKKEIYVDEPLPYKMFIGDVDYDLIKNFDRKYSGWKIRNADDTIAQTVQTNSGVLSEDSTTYIRNIQENPWYNVDKVWSNEIFDGVGEISIESTYTNDLKMTKTRYIKWTNNGEIVSEDVYWDNNDDTQPIQVIDEDEYNVLSETQKLQVKKVESVLEFDSVPMGRYVAYVKKDDVEEQIESPITVDFYEGYKKDDNDVTLIAYNKLSPSDKLLCTPNLTEEQKEKYRPDTKNSQDVNYVTDLNEYKSVVLTDIEFMSLSLDEQEKYEPNVEYVFYYIDGKETTRMVVNDTNTAIIVSEFCTANLPNVNYNWCDDYIAKDFIGIPVVEDNRADFINVVNEVIVLRNELPSLMKQTFYITCTANPKTININVQTEDLPATSMIVYHEEYEPEEGDNNILLNSDMTAFTDEFTVDDVTIPTISYESSPIFGNGGDSDMPCIAQVVNNENATIKKKPYFVGVVNDISKTIPDGLDVSKETAINKISEWTKIAKLFTFPLIDKIVDFDYVAWSKTDAYTYGLKIYVKKIDNNFTFTFVTSDMYDSLRGADDNKNHYVKYGYINRDNGKLIDVMDYRIMQNTEKANYAPFYVKICDKYVTNTEYNGYTAYRNKKTGEVISNVQYSGWSAYIKGTDTAITVEEYNNLPVKTIAQRVNKNMYQLKSVTDDEYRELDRDIKPKYKKLEEYDTPSDYVQFFISEDVLNGYKAYVTYKGLIDKTHPEAGVLSVHDLEWYVIRKNRRKRLQDYYITPTTFEGLPPEEKSDGRYVKITISETEYSGYFAYKSGNTVISNDEYLKLSSKNKKKYSKFLITKEKYLVQDDKSLYTRNMTNKEQNCYDKVCITAETYGGMVSNKNTRDEAAKYTVSYTTQEKDLYTPNMSETEKGKYVHEVYVLITRVKSEQSSSRYQPITITDINGGTIATNYYYDTKFLKYEKPSTMGGTYETLSMFYKDDITLGGSLGLIVKNGNVTNGKLDTQTLGDLDITLSKDIMDHSTTFIEKRILSKYDKGDELKNMGIYNPYADYVIVDNTDVEKQYVGIRPSTQRLEMEDKDMCGLDSTIYGGMKVEVTEDAINDCTNPLNSRLIVTAANNGGQKTTYYVMKLDTDKLVPNYPLNYSIYNTDTEQYEIQEQIKEIYSREEPYNIFSFRTTEDALRNNTNSTFISKLLTIEGGGVNESGEEVPESVVETTSRGYGNTGLFEYQFSRDDKKFAYVAAVTENGTRALSPVYDFSCVSASFTYGASYGMVETDGGGYQQAITEAFVDAKLVLDGDNDYDNFYFKNYDFELEIINYKKPEEEEEAEVEDEDGNDVMEENFIVSGSLRDPLEHLKENITADEFLNFGQTMIVAIDKTGLRHLCNINDGTEVTPSYDYIVKFFAKPYNGGGDEGVEYKIGYADTGEVTTDFFLKKFVHNETIGYRLPTGIDKCYKYDGYEALHAYVKVNSQNTNSQDAVISPTTWNSLPNCDEGETLGKFNYRENIIESDGGTHDNYKSLTVHDAEYNGYKAYYAYKVYAAYMNNNNSNDVISLGEYNGYKKASGSVIPSNIPTNITTEQYNGYFAYVNNSDPSVVKSNDEYNTLSDVEKQGYTMNIITADERQDLEEETLRDKYTQMTETQQGYYTEMTDNDRALYHLIYASPKEYDGYHTYKAYINMDDGNVISPEKYYGYVAYVKKDASPSSAADRDVISVEEYLTPNGNINPEEYVKTFITKAEYDSSDFGDVRNKYELADDGIRAEYYEYLVSPSIYNGYMTFDTYKAYKVYRAWRAYYRYSFAKPASYYDIYELIDDNLPIYYAYFNTDYTHLENYVLSPSEYDGEDGYEKISVNSAQYGGYFAYVKGDAICDYNYFWNNLTPEGREGYSISILTYAEVQDLDPMIQPAYLRIDDYFGEKFELKPNLISFFDYNNLDVNDTKLYYEKGLSVNQYFGYYAYVNRKNVNDIISVEEYADRNKFDKMNYRVDFVSSDELNKISDIFTRRKYVEMPVSWKIRYLTDRSGEYQSIISPQEYNGYFAYVLRSSDDNSELVISEGEYNGYFAYVKNSNPSEVKAIDEYYPDTDAGNYTRMMITVDEYNNLPQTTNREIILKSKYRRMTDIQRFAYVMNVITSKDYDKLEDDAIKVKYSRMDSDHQGLYGDPDFVSQIDPSVQGKYGESIVSDEFYQTNDEFIGKSKYRLIHVNYDKFWERHAWIAYVKIDDPTDVISIDDYNALPTIDEKSIYNKDTKTQDEYDNIQDADIKECYTDCVLNDDNFNGYYAYKAYVKKNHPNQFIKWSDYCEYSGQDKSDYRADVKSEGEYLDLTPTVARNYEKYIITYEYYNTLIDGQEKYAKFVEDEDKPKFDFVMNENRDSYSLVIVPIGTPYVRNEHASLNLPVYINRGQYNGYVRKTTRPPQPSNIPYIISDAQYNGYFAYVNNSNPDDVKSASEYRGLDISKVRKYTMSIITFEEYNDTENPPVGKTKYTQMGDTQHNYYKAMNDGGEQSEQSNYTDGSANGLFVEDYKHEEEENYTHVYMSPSDYENLCEETPPQKRKKEAYDVDEIIKSEYDALPTSEDDETKNSQDKYSVILTDDEKNSYIDVIISSEEHANEVDVEDEDDDVYEQILTDAERREYTLMTISESEYDDLATEDKERCVRYVISDSEYYGYKVYHAYINKTNANDVISADVWGGLDPDEQAKYYEHVVSTELSDTYEDYIISLEQYNSHKAYHTYLAYETINDVENNKLSAYFRKTTFDGSDYVLTPEEWAEGGESGNYGLITITQDIYDNGYVAYVGPNDTISVDYWTDNISDNDKENYEIDFKSNGDVEEITDQQKKDAYEATTVKQYQYKDKLTPDVKYNFITENQWSTLGDKQSNYEAKYISEEQYNGWYAYVNINNNTDVITHTEMFGDDVNVGKNSREKINYTLNIITQYEYENITDDEIRGKYVQMMGSREREKFTEKFFTVNDYENGSTITGDARLKSTVSVMPQNEYQSLSEEDDKRTDYAGTYVSGSVSPQYNCKYTKFWITADEYGGYYAYRAYVNPNDPTDVKSVETIGYTESIISATEYNEMLTVTVWQKNVKAAYQKHVISADTYADMDDSDDSAKYKYTKCISDNEKIKYVENYNSYEKTLFQPNIITTYRRNGWTQIIADNTNLYTYDDYDASRLQVVKPFNLYAIWEEVTQTTP